MASPGERARAGQATTQQVPGSRRITKKYLCLQGGQTWKEEMETENERWDGGERC